MKKINKLTSALVVTGALFFFSSCNPGEEKKADEPAVKQDSSAVQKTEPVKPGNLMLITHKVANYAKWKMAYDAHDSVRRSYGLHNYLLTRGVEDTNRVMVALWMDDAAKAKEFVAMPNLKDAMKKGGVLGVPTFGYIDVQMYDTVTTNASSTRMMLSHKVKDYDTWKKEFDSHKQARMDAGLADRLLGYEVGDNKTVTIVFAVSDLKKARDFLASKDLKDKMTAAGVEGPPSIFLYSVSQKY